ncbi:hypothetical protein Mal15_20720 [Stieleria maiorica]|uniref:Uncharacterized protein n=1 Tax=Stieleria maiorica TaxID=2795974 RepID=A0A5B9MES1_9BACT|nr:hypothetical protein [Stieleria maiorica]QEF98025.1 hypothetical protein Mal15_20720 [Stieleria maiorica]
MSKRRFGKFWLILGVLLLAVIGLLATQLRRVDHVSEASATTTFELEIPFNRFKQIMVRKNATRAIVAHGGMELVSQSIQGLNVDMSKEDRPILNALRGRSKTELDATRMLTVRFTNPDIDAQELTLRQQADIDSDRMHVETKSVAEQGEIKDYQTTLTAEPAEGDATRVTLQTAMKIQVDVAKLFVSVADTRVNASAESAVNQQKAALTEFVLQHADQAIVLPDLFGGGDKAE